VLAALIAESGPLTVSPATRLFWIVGICGGYTTFSSFSLQTLILLEQADWVRAALNILLSVALCLAAVWLGFHLAGRWTRP
jgi:CrcB protein